MRSRLTLLSADLQRIFGARLLSLVAYGDIDGNPEGTHTLALVEAVSFADLAACAPLVDGWHRAGLAVPLLLTRDEFLRTLDVFPLEYGGIIARHVVVFGDSPFAGMQVSEGDRRRACELQAKSHLIHLREAYLEGGGQPPSLRRLMTDSAEPLRALAANLEALDPGIDDRAGLTPDLIEEVARAGSSTIADPSALFARYLSAIERLWRQVDGWRG